MERRSQPDFTRLLHVRSAYGPTFSPDGSRIACITDLTGVAQGWIVPLQGGWPERVTFTDDRVGLVSFAPNDDRLLFAWDWEGNEKHRLVLIDRDGSTIPLTQNGDRMHPFGAWSSDGSFIVYASNERDVSIFDIVRQNLATGDVDLVLQGEGMLRVEAVSPDDRWLLAIYARGSFDELLYRVDLSNGSVTDLAPHVGSARFTAPSWSLDGSTVYVVTDVDDEFERLVALDVETLRRTPIDRGGADVEHAASSPDGSRIAYVRNIDGYSELVVLRLDTGRELPVPQLPAGIIGRGSVSAWRDSLAWSRDSRYLAFSIVGPCTAQNIWVIDTTGGTAWQVTYATQAGINTGSLAEPKSVRYATFDGREIPAFLYAPPGAEPDGDHTAIIQIHGGPEGQSRPAYDPVVQYLVLSGYVVLVPNVRGSTGYGKVYSHLDDVEKRLDSVADVAAGARWLTASGWASPDRIVPYGGSYGGFMVLSCLTEYPELWAAGVEFYGIADFVTFFQRTAPWRRRHRAKEYGDPQKDRGLFERISPIRRIDRIKVPLFVFHGKNDPRVPIEETEQIVAAVQAQGVPVEYFRAEDEGHGVTRLGNRLAVYPAVVRFLDRFVPAR
ncbi:MAG: S9 family peptidase [Chloroflexi bacterium]|nr:S9 family peptidase [Chloroflexota bacterium]